jgi:putative hydrolase of the HAD superfamily
MSARLNAMKALLLDLDDTLLDYSGGVEDAWREACVECSVPLGIDPDALETLEELHRRRVPLALVTNGDASQQRDKIERYRLAHFFEAIVIEGEFGVGKPDPAVYRHALAALGADPGNAWMAGDHLEFDVDGPQRLGIRGAWIDRDGRGLPDRSPVRPHRIIRSLSELTAAAW